MYLRELCRQAAIFDSSLYDALRCALVENDVEECWRHLQGALFAAVVVIRLVQPTGTLRRGTRSARETNKIAQKRASRLRELVGLPEPDQDDMTLYKLRPFRNVMEHIDERLDEIAEAPSGSLSDWYLSGGTVFVRDVGSQSAPLGLRSFDPTAGVLVIDDDLISLFQLDIEMLHLQAHSKQAIVQTRQRITGRSQFGGVQIANLGDIERRLRSLRTWDAQRTELLAAGDDLVE